jgi:branched-chain amino acid aminotransferase
VPPECIDPALKPLNYLNNIMAKIETIQAGVPEGIMLSCNGYVSECTGDNLFLVTGDCLVTPPLHIGNLKGITRQAIIDIAHAQGMCCNEELFRMHDVYNADEVFLTGTAAEVIPAVKIDGRAIGDGTPGSVTQRLRESFRELTQREGTPIHNG